MEDHIRQNQNFYQAELGKFPSDWPEVTLDELNSGQSPALKAGPFGSSLTKDIYVKSGFKVYGQEQVIRGDLAYGNYFIDEKKYRELKSCAVSEGDILLSLVGTAGKLLVVDSSATAGVINPRLIRFRFDSKKISSNFFKYLFESEIVQNHLETSAQGGTMAVLNAGMLKNLPIPLPELPEQNAIANALSDVDALLSELENLIVKKQAIKTATMQQLLTGKTRLPQFATYTEGAVEGKRKGTKPSELGEIPEDWVILPLSKTLKDNPKYGINAAAVPLQGSLPVYIRITDISEDGYFKPTELVGVNSPFSNDYQLEVGDIVLARTGASVGKSYLYNESDGKLVYAGFLIKVTPNKDKLMPEFLFQYLKTEQYWGWVTVNSMRSGQPGINGNEYGQLPIVVPTIGEQIAIATILSDMDNEIKSFEQRLAKTRQIKQGMMQQLLTGRTRLPFKRLVTEQDGGS